GTQPNRPIVIPDVAALPPQQREEKREKEPAVPPALAWTGIGVLGLMLILGGMRALLSTSESPANVDAIAEVRPAVAPAAASATATTPPKRTSIADEASKPPPLVVEAFPSAEP